MIESLYELIRRYEGLRLRAYLCPAGVWTIGYGSTGADVGPGLAWTAQQAESRMRQDALLCFLTARALCPAATSGQAVALADFAYNLGSARLAGSTLRRRLNAGDVLGASQEFEKWVFAGGVKLPGLVLRRQAEQLIFLS